MNWQIRAGTQNRKLGLGAYVVSLSSDTCPNDCPLKSGGCYAKQGHLRIHWDRLDAGESSDKGPGRWKGSGFSSLASALIRHVPAGTLLRIGDVGDPSNNGRVSIALIRALGTLKRRGVRSIVYTHAKPADNRRALAVAAELGVAVNFSNHGHLGTRPGGEGQRVTTVAPEYWETHEESTVGTLRCPAETRPDVTCDSCGLCSRERGYAIAFTAHGSQGKRVSEVSR